jgi:hypothetical protein
MMWRAFSTWPAALESWKKPAASSGVDDAKSVSSDPSEYNETAGVFAEMDDAEGAAAQAGAAAVAVGGGGAVGGIGKVGEWLNGLVGRRPRQRRRRRLLQHEEVEDENPYSKGISIGSTDAETPAPGGIRASPPPR